MLTYSLDKNNKSPLYEQLYIKIRNDISSGKIESGARLPSKRMLSEHLGVSKVTVESAYAQLIAEGYIYSVEKKGYFAEKVAVVSCALPENKNQIVKETKKGYLADLQSNSVSLEHFPFSVWSKLMREITLDFSSELMASVPYNGALSLREAICTYLAENRGMSVMPSQVIVGAGTEYLYGLIVQLLGFDKRFALENPSYGKISKVYSAFGADCVFVDMDSEGVSIKSLEESGAQVLHISPAHHFPTGIVTQQKRRYEILEWASVQNDRFIIEDEYDSEFRFLGKPIPPMQTADRSGKVIYINTFSKTIAPSIRISYMILPPSLAEKYYEKLGFYSCTVPAFEQYTLARFISDGYFERHLNRMKRYYRVLRDEITLLIKNSPVAKKSRILESDSGLHFILEIRTEKSDAEISEFCLERGVRLSFLSEYYHSNREKYSHLVLINYSGISKEEFSKALECLNYAVEN